MTVVTPESALDILQDLEGDWEIACDMLSKQREWGYPVCNGRPAEWVAWRANCCPQSPRYYLMCDDCKFVYQKWEAMQAHFTCGWCGEDIDGFLTWTPLEKRS